MSRQTRRAFLKTAAAGAALTLTGASAFAQSSTKKKKKTKPKVSDRIIGANERVRVGVAGIHGRGGDHIKGFTGLPGVEVAYLIDPDSRIFNQRIKDVERLAKNTPKCFQDIRKALEEKDLNAVSVATCNHWHSLITYWACQAGKDVYVEKPCSHNVFEGRKIVEAAQKYKRMVQHGTQSRSDARWARSCAAAQSGKYGKLLVSKTWASKVRWSIGFKPVKEPPKELDYNLWLGPAPMQPYNENFVHYNWHWFWDFGNGELANQGVHQMDIARWSIGELTQPLSVISMGGRWVEGPDFKDQAQTPNEQLIVFDVGGTLVVYEIRGLNGKKGPAGGQFAQHVDNEFYLEAGTIKGGKFYPKGTDKPEDLVKVEYKLGPGEPGDHYDNFIQAVRSRKVEDLNAPITTGHPSAMMCHLGNISYRLGTQIPFGKGYDALGENAHVTASIQAIEEQLKGALGVDLSKATYQLGAKLRFDPKTEKFIDNPEADKLLTRNYREPFVVRETV
jgi:predicted dehydrogenase